MNTDSEMRASIIAMLNRALAAHQAGNLVEAEHIYNLIIAHDGKQFDALHMLAVLHAQRGNLDAADRFFQNAAEIKPDYAPCHYNRGNVLIELKQFEKAMTCYDRALAITPGYVEAHFNRGNALLKSRRLSDALASFDRALRLNPNIAEIHSSRGNALRALNRFDEALVSFDQALRLQPNHAEFHANRGNVLHELGRLDEALTSFEKALKTKPDDAEVHYNCGNVLYEIGWLEKALISFDKAIAIRPNDAEFYHNRGNVLLDLGRPEKALADYDKAWTINPFLPYLEGARLNAKMQLCDWVNLAAEESNLLANIRNGIAASIPFPVLAMPSTPADQLRCAQIYATDKYPNVARLDRALSANRRHHSQDRIRICYLSADLQNHATAHLAAGLFEHHDRTCFETIAISFGLDDGSTMRARLLKGFDKFIDARAMSTQEIARLVRDMKIDITVDLNGYTQRARTGIVAMRPAPLQVSYLGYPGTMGASFIDYILADKIVIPRDHQPYYSEKIVYLPHSYQANDAKRDISAKKLTRAEAGLPESGFVFCSFNNNYKITPEIFSLWMKLLQQIDGSVLWLLAGNVPSQANLRSEAQRRGVSAERLVFAPKIPIHEHLGRHRLADLFLDTLPYNAHTTASDALWTGLPIVTCLGSTFAGRVAASLLTATGLSELVTQSLDEYMALTMRLARDPTLLGSIKAKLASGRDSCPLFDTARFTRNVEAAYSHMWERHRRGEAPAATTIEA